ncbi:MAG: DegT/DnrJ/EryC1/StrS family aminotransferase, partial [Spirochaetota bacterium]
MSIVSNKPTITRNELEGVLDCLINDELTSGHPVVLFEKSLSEMTGYTYCCALQSPTSAYHVALCALGITAGDEVIVPSYFTQSALNAICLCGAEPVLLDIDENSLSASVERYQAAVTDRTKAVIIGHTGGIYVDSESYKSLPVPVIEDISHCLGVEAQESNAGYFGTIALSSFSPNDMITTGSGGAVFTSNSRYYSTMKDLR